MDCSAARIMIAKNVTPYQTLAMTTAVIAVSGSASHGIGWLIRPAFCSRSLTTPNSPLNIQRNRMPIRKPEIAHGKKMSAWYSPRRRNRRLSHSAIAKPIRNCGTIEATTQKTVLLSTVPHAGSAKMSRKLPSPIHEVSVRSLRFQCRKAIWLPVIIG